MDNASSIPKRLCSAAQTTHCMIIFLHPYSTELKPIKKFWFHLKRCLRNILQFSPSLDDALHSAFKPWQLYHFFFFLPCGVSLCNPLFTSSYARFCHLVNKN